MPLGRKRSTTAIEKIGDTDLDPVLSLSYAWKDTSAKGFIRMVVEVGDALP